MELVISSGPEAGHSYNLGNKPMTLGTDPASEIAVADTAMAGQHARFEIIGGTLYVTDLASNKGTYLNGQRMSPAARYPLRPGDAMQIGSTLFKIQETPAPVAAPTPAPGEVPLQPYQYQISTAFSTPPAPPPVPAPVPAPVPQPTQSFTPVPQTTQSFTPVQVNPAYVPMNAVVPTNAPASTAANTTTSTATSSAAVVTKTKGKVSWSAIIASVFVLGLLVAAIVYFVNSSNPNNVDNTGQTTRTTGRPSPTRRLPTNTPDQAGALFQGSTPGIGSDVTVTPVRISTSDLPTYPAARRIDNPTLGIYFTQYVTTDGFDKLTEWAQPAFTAKGWTNLDIKMLPGKEGAVLTGRKGNLNLVVYLLGPGQRDTAPYDNYFRSANVNTNEAVVVINVTNA